MSTADWVRSYIQKGYGKTVGPDDSLIDSGLLDSVGIFELVTHLEEEFGIKIEDDAIVPENFETADAVARFVDAKRGGRAT